MTALGLASNIIQLISFTSDIVSKSRELYKSQDGKLVEHAELEAITKNLQELSNDIIFPSRHRSAISQADKDLAELCEGCKEISRQLIGAIQGLKAQRGNKRWNSFRQALKTIWKEDEIARISERLDRYRAQIDTRLLVSLTTTLEKQDRERKRHIGIINVEEQQSIPGTRETKSWAMELIEAVDRHRRELEGQTDVDWFSSQVSASTDIQREKVYKAKILENLRFATMGDRYERIEDAHKKTFEWIFLCGQEESDAPRAASIENSESLMELLSPTKAGYVLGTGLNRGGSHPRWSNFPNWLQGNGGMYWITGKPGSGKSTLMKYLYNEERTSQLLEQWTGKRPLLTAGFFLWNSGTVMQMSKMGLLRALLHQSIQAGEGATDLIPDLFPDRWRSYELFGGDVHPWSWPELSRAFDIMISDDSKNFFFAIDGLDEFDGDCAEIANFVLEKSTVANVKLCVASRPWLVFEDTFQRQPSLRLEDLTAPDIHLFASEKLHDNIMFNYLEDLQPQEASRLIVEVTSKASGVFLWVRLVIMSLLEGLRDGDNIDHLHQRLLSLPSDLEQLFEKILNNLNPLYFEQASKLFQFHRAASEPLSLLSLSFAEDGFEKAMSADVATMSTQEINFRMETMRRRLSSRCKGLIYTPSFSQVEYLHRTVQDFFKSPKIWEYIKSGTPDSFDPDLMLCGAFLRQIKVLHKQQFNIFKVFLRQFCSYSLRLCPRETSSHISSLKELDRAVTVLMNGISGPESGIFQSSDDGTNPHHWCAILDTPHDIQLESFFEYAFRYPFHEYVESQLKAGQSSESQIDGKPLLFHAVESADVHMMRILLEHGADPNAIQDTGVTIWEHVLKKLQETSRYYSSRPNPPKDPEESINFGNWAKTIRVFLEYNADPCTSLDNMPVKDLLQKAFDLWDRSLTKDLVDLLVTAKKTYKPPMHQDSNPKVTKTKTHSDGIVRRIFKHRLSKVHSKAISENPASVAQIFPVIPQRNPSSKHYSATAAGKEVDKAVDGYFAISRGSRGTNGESEPYL